MKKLLPLILILALMVCLLSFQVSAETEGGFTYTVTDGKATITGYTGSATELTIPSTLGGCPVTSIGDYAFRGRTSLTSVTIGDSVTKIGWNAFRDCSSLTSVTIGDSVTSIVDDAFYDCVNLTSVYITDIVAWCNINFGNNGSNPLFYAGNLYLNNALVTDLVIPNNVTSIGISSFRGCTSLTSVTIGDSVTEIGRTAFYGCSSLTSVTIPDSVTTINGGTFSGCTALEEITIPVSMFSISDNAFIDVPLKTVHYAGTEEQWNKIDLNNNACFATAEIKFTQPETSPEETPNQTPGETTPEQNKPEETTPEENQPDQTQPTTAEKNEQPGEETKGLPTVAIVLISGFVGILLGILLGAGGMYLLITKIKKSA